ncbi:hypothetical protein [Methylobacterium sp. B4]|uniref:hypothetical protein n=1 Tax=Methylobacterium sp. B4 TaxID=1938755 RepID=UPI000D771223|nr:hypothetical protein [Methylobacterium sp. B4]
MTDASAEEQSEKLGEVARLATLMADRILEAQIMDRPIPQEQFTAFVDAAHLLQERGVPWPPLVEQILNDAGKPRVTDPQPESDRALAGLTRFFSSFRRS